MGLLLLLLLLFSSGIIFMTTSTWQGRNICEPVTFFGMWKTRSAYRIFDGKPEGKIPHCLLVEDNIKMYLREIRCDDMYLIKLA
jgi:hypothetical protein